MPLTIIRPCQTPLIKARAAIGCQQLQYTPLSRLATPWAPLRMSLTKNWHPYGLASKSQLASLHVSRCSLKSPKQSPSSIPHRKIDREYERKLANQILEVRPHEVTTTSSVRRVFEEPQDSPEEVKPVTESLKEELDVIRDTFALSTVPREAYYLGLAGTLPYLFTSLTTMYLSWDINRLADLPTPSPTPVLDSSPLPVNVASSSVTSFLNSLLLADTTATHWLHLLEPIQIGYGAVLISFLGAIHWGLEFAEAPARSVPVEKRKPSEPKRSVFRYSVGVFAPILAWPTVFMSIEWALTSQFAAFTFMYWADVRATERGWAPPWYGMYRFVLTGVVGIAIFVSLVGRAKVGEGKTRLSMGELRQRMSGGGTHGGKRKLEGENAKEISQQEERERERKREEQKHKGAPSEDEKKAKEEEERSEKKEANQRREKRREKHNEEHAGKQSKMDSPSSEQG